MGIYNDVIGAERQENFVNVGTANTPTQVILVPWSAANKQGILEKVVISNQNASAAIVKFFDEDVTTSGTSGTNKPSARGTAAAPIHPWINVPAGTQVFIGENECANIRLQGGLAAEATQTTVQIYAQVIVY
jgi:hypothetical protein